MSTVIIGPSTGITFPDGSKQKTAGVPNNGPCFGFSAAANQSAPAGASTRIFLATPLFTPEGVTVTGNYRFQPNVKGIYLVCAEVRALGTSIGTLAAEINKSGFTYARGQYSTGSGSAAGNATVSALVEMDGMTDYFELWGYVNGTGTLNFTIDNSSSKLMAHLVRALP